MPASPFKNLGLRAPLTAEQLDTLAFESRVGRRDTPPPQLHAHHLERERTLRAARPDDVPRRPPNWLKAMIQQDKSVADRVAVLRQRLDGAVSPRRLWESLLIANEFARDPEGLAALRSMLTQSFVTNLSRKGR